MDEHHRPAPKRATVQPMISPGCNPTGPSNSPLFSFSSLRRYVDAGPSTQLMIIIEAREIADNNKRTAIAFQNSSPQLGGRGGGGLTLSRAPKCGLRRKTVYSMGRKTDVHHPLQFRRYASPRNQKIEFRIRRNDSYRTPVNCYRTCTNRTCTHAICPRGLTASYFFFFLSPVMVL